MQISQEHLEKLRQISSEQEQLALELGRIQGILIKLNVEKDFVENNFKKNLAQENEMREIISQHYGNVNINLQDGTIISHNNEEN
jgi:thioredoxin-related protein